ncbi:hypothetical protein Scep_012122 [Stephania cephalantha]|uniref:Uncharacterized protein n=1 Tax=Stephania cephalantha TaxID=152367 RepID=A0AAP0P765_9MAGN
MAYMGRYQQLLPFANDVADGDRDQVHFFGKGLVPAIRGTVVTTLPPTLHDAYECGLAREAYLRTHPEENHFYDEVEKEIGVISERPDEPQIESEEDQPLVLLKSKPRQDREEGSTTFIHEFEKERMGMVKVVAPMKDDGVCNEFTVIRQGNGEDD